MNGTRVLSWLLTGGTASGAASVSLSCAECNRPNRTWPTVDGLEAHICQDHLHWIPYACPQATECPYVRLPTDSALRQHLRNNHGSSDHQKVTYTVDIENEKKLEKILYDSIAHKLHGRVESTNNANNPAVQLALSHSVDSNPRHPLTMTDKGMRKANDRNDRNEQTPATTPTDSSTSRKRPLADKQLPPPASAPKRQKSAPPNNTATTINTPVRLAANGKTAQSSSDNPAPKPKRGRRPKAATEPATTDEPPPPAPITRAVYSRLSNPKTNPTPAVSPPMPPPPPPAPQVMPEKKTRGRGKKTDQAEKNGQKKKDEKVPPVKKQPAKRGRKSKVDLLLADAYATSQAPPAVTQLPPVTTTAPPQTKKRASNKKSSAVAPPPAAPAPPPANREFSVRINRNYVILQKQSGQTRPIFRPIKREIIENEFQPPTRRFDNRVPMRPINKTSAPSAPPTFYNQPIPTINRAPTATQGPPNNRSAPPAPVAPPASASSKTIVCRLCNKTMTSGQSRHIYTIHMRKSIIKCSVCDYGSMYGRTKVMQHIKERHPNSGAVAIDLRQEMRKEIAEWTTKCFGRVKMEKPETAIATTGALTTKNSVNTQRRHSEGATKSKQSAASALVPTRAAYSYCFKCSKNLPSDEQPLDHVYKLHTKKHMFKCPICSYSATSDATVRKHLKAVHSATGIKWKAVDQRQFGPGLVSVEFRHCFIKPDPHQLAEMLPPPQNPLSRMSIG